MVANVGQDSRRSGRVPVDKLLEDLEREKSALILEKQALQIQLSDIDNWKRKEVSQILARRMEKTDTTTAMSEIAWQAKEKKSGLMKQMMAVDKRLHDIKARFARGGDVQRQDVQVLLRIEQLLIELINKVGA